MVREGLSKGNGRSAPGMTELGEKLRWAWRGLRQQMWLAIAAQRLNR